MNLLISDFAMPGMNGLTLIREARRRRPELLVLLLTGYADAGVRRAIEATEMGCVTLLRKPVSGTMLAAHAATMLDRHAPS